jgi:signal peptidase II
MADVAGPEAQVPPSTRRRLVTAVGLALTVIVLDQATKTWAEHHLADRTIHLFWTLRLNLVYNSGAAFGFGRGYGPYLMLAGAVVLVLVLVLARPVLLLRSALLTIALGLILGGALGNVVDRVVRNNGGAVIDFIDAQWWPVFNVADIALSAGCVLLAIGGSRGES